MISRSLIPAFRTDMNSFTEFFLACMSATLWADLRSVLMVNLSKVFVSFPTYPRQQIAELAKTTIQHLFTKKTPGSHFKVDVLNKNHVCLVAEKMTSLKVKILSSIRDLMMKSSNFKLCFFPVFRPLIFTRCSPLQHFKPTLEFSKKLRGFNSEIVTRHQKRFQTDIDADSSSKRYWVGNINITLDGYNCIPNSSPCSSYNPDSLDFKSFGDWSMAVNRHLPNLGQFYEGARAEETSAPCVARLIARNWIFFELRKEKGLVSTIFLISRKAKTTSFESFPGVMQSFNHILSYLRMNIFIEWINLFPLCKLSLLFQVTRERNIGRHNIFPIQRAREQTTFPRINPIFEVAQTSVIKISARLQPFQHHYLLFGSWINSIGVVHGKHTLILA